MQEGRENKQIHANYFHPHEGAGENADAERAGGEKIHANYLSSTRGNVEIRGCGKHSPCISPDPCVHLKESASRQVFFLPPFLHPPISFNSTRESREIRGC